MKAPDKRHNTLLKNEADAVIAEANAGVFSSSIETFEIGDVLKSSSHLNLFDNLLDSAKQRGIIDIREIRVE